MAEDAAIETLTCPSCGAVLRNVKADPGARVRCLNCGKRFVPEQGPDARVAAGGTPAARTTATPRGAGYWLLRIPAAILCAAALVGTLFSLISYISAMAMFPRNFGAELLAPPLYLPLLAWQGVALVLLTTALARADAGAVQLAWRTRALKEPLPAVPGSSLPYIAPLAITGGLLPVVVICVSQNDVEAGLIGGLWGGALFYVGFAMEDLRQFTWRQEMLARACCGDAPQNSPRAAPRVVPRCGLLLSGVGLLAAAATIAFWIATFRWRWRYVSRTNPEDLIPLFFGVALVAVSYSAYVLGRGWDRAVAWWSLAAANAEAKARLCDNPPGLSLPQSGRIAAQPDAGPGQGEFRFPWRRCTLFTVFFILWVVLARVVEDYGSYRDIHVTAARGVMWVTGAVLLSVATLFLMRSVGQELKTGLTPGMRRFCRVPVFWIVYGVLWLLLTCLVEGWPHWEWETLGGLLLCLAGGVVAAWVAVFLAQVSRWRNAQERFWRVTQPDGARAQARQPSWQNWLVGGVMWLVLIQACLFTCIMFSSVYGRLGLRASETTSFPLLLVIAHYPTLWMAMLLREMLAVGWFYKSREETE